MPKKDINLLPEDLREKKIKIPKIRFERRFDLNKPIEDIFETAEGKSEKVELKKEISGVKFEQKPPAPKVLEEKKPLAMPSMPPRQIKKTGEKEELSSPVPTETKEGKPSKGIFTISKTKPNIISQLKDLLTKFQSKGFSLKNLIKKGEVEQPYHLDINLILKEKGALKTRERKILKMLYLEIIGCLIIILISYSYLFFSQWKIGDEGKKLRQEITETDNQINNFRKEEGNLIDIQKKILYINDLLNRHIYWTKFFAYLEKYTLSDVYYTDFGASFNENLVLKGVAKNSQAMVRQILSFQNADDFLEGVEVKDIALKSEEGDIEFIVNLILKPDIFVIKNENVE